MSFGSEVKKELMGTKLLSRKQEKALLMGILHNSSELVVSTKNRKLNWSLTVKTSILSVITFVSQYFKKYYNTNDEFKTKEKNNLNKFRYYYLEVDNVADIVKDFKLFDYRIENLTPEYLGLDTLELKNIYLRGLFITHGSISNPRMSTYHLEIATSIYEIANLAVKIFADNGIKASILVREHKRADDTYLVYIKKAEDISQALVIIGATQGMFNFEDQRIYRDYKNMANRVTNCDIANERKCLQTAKKQLDAIKYIRDHYKFEEMSIRLQSIALLRETYPDSSNEELSEFSSNIFGRELSKSGISHCFRSLMEYYDSIIENNKSQH